MRKLALLLTLLLLTDKPSSAQETTPSNGADPGQTMVIDVEQNNSQDNWI